MVREDAARARARPVACLALGVCVLLGGAPLPLAAGAAGDVVTNTTDVDYDCTWDGSSTSFAMPVHIETTGPESFVTFGDEPGDGLALTLTMDATLPGEVAKQLHDDGGRSFTGALDGGIARGLVGGSAVAATLHVPTSIPETDLGSQTTATPVSFRAATVPFGEPPAGPSGVQYYAAAFRLDLAVARPGSDPVSETIHCTQRAYAWPILTTVWWMSRTHVGVELSKTTVEHGEDVALLARTTAVAGTPSGYFEVSLGERTWWAADFVPDGVTTISLPAIKPGRYPAGVLLHAGSGYLSSRAVTATSLTVTKAPSKVGARLRGTRAGRRATARLTVQGVHDTVAGGRVRLVLQNPSRPAFGKRTRQTRLEQGRAKVRLGQLAAGRYRLKVVYRGDVKHRTAHLARTFRVRH